MTVKKIRNIILYFCAVLFVGILTLSIVTACGGVKDTDTDFYLSRSSDEWKVYQSGEDIPESVHFKHNGDIYTLKTDLEEGEEFTVNRVGSDSKIGFDQIFSVADHLVRGGNGAIKVAHSGTYELSFSVAENTLNYTFTARRVSVKITTDILTLHTEESYQYKASAVYSDGKEVEENAAWTSSDQSVLTVDEQGNVSAIAVGKATLTAAIGELSDSIEIEVLQSYVPVKDVTLDRTELNLEIGEEETLIATVLPENAESRLVSWSSGDDSVATVSNGTVKAVGYGTTEITVSTAQGGHEAKCTVTVIRHVTAMRFDAETLTVTAGGEFALLKVIYAPSTATYKTCDIEIVDGNEFISIEEDEENDAAFKVTGLEAGTATIQATLKENPEITATCTVKVVAAGSVLAKMQANVTTMIGEPANLTVSLENDTIQSVAWSVADRAVATVQGNGKDATVTGVDFGSTVVTAKVTTTSGAVYTAKSNVLVADDYYFIYGYGLGAYDWDYSDYVSDRNAAERDGLLFEETNRGVYTLTRHFTEANGFQIIFPKVANYTQEDDAGDAVWNKNIPSRWVAVTNYYDTIRSDKQYITNATEYFCVNTPGIYTVTLDLTGTKAQVYLEVVSLDIASVDLTIQQGSAVLKNDEIVFDFSVSPSAAKFNENEVEVQFASEFADYANYIDYDLRVSDAKLAVSVIKKVTESFTVTLTLTIRGVSTSIDLYVLSESDEEVPVSSVTFEQEHYYVNVNQGGAANAWQTTVKALVDEKATNRQVRYLNVTDYTEIKNSAKNTYATVNAETGLVTAKKLGTVIVKAVALTDETVFATCSVTFYSDQIYILGKGMGGWTPLDDSYRSVEGTAFENNKFEMLSETHFRFEGKFPYNAEFQFGFCGMDDKWISAITYAHLLPSAGNAVYGYYEDYDHTGDLKSTWIKDNTKSYIIDLDLSKHMPFWVLNVTESEDFEGVQLIYDQTNTTLEKEEMLTVNLYLIPEIELSQDEVSYRLDGDSNYLDVKYDAALKRYTLKVIATEHSEDKDVTFTVTVKGKELSVPLKIIAEHHLELQWNDDYHWLGCTDKGCDYIEGEKLAHNREETLAANGEGHYTACSECGVQIGFAPHKYALNDSGVFDFSDGMKQCSECGFDLFKIEGNTLVAYYGKAEKVKVPDEVTVIGDHAFEGHSELQELTYSDKLTKVGSYAFAGCSSLKQIKLPNRVTEIGGYAFQGTAATIAWGVNAQITYLGQYAFYGYLGTELAIPKKVTDFGYKCFAYSNLTSFVIPDTITFTNVKDNAGEFLFQNCTSLRNVVVGASATQIEAGMFSGCTSLETVIVRSTGFYQIHNNAFDNCPSFKGIYFCRPLDQLLTCKWLFHSTTVETLKGRAYAYSDENPGGDPFGDAMGDTFDYFRDWFAGCWHWDNSGEQTLEHIELWDETQQEVNSLAFIIDDKRNCVSNAL